MRQRSVELHTRLNEIADLDEDGVTTEVREEWTELLAERDALADEIAELEEFQRSVGPVEIPDIEPEAIEEAAQIQQRSTMPAIDRKRDPWDRAELSRSDGSDNHSRALSAAEQVADTDDRVREALTRAIEFGQGQIPELVLATTSPDYRRAFGDYLVDGVMDRTNEAVRYAEPMRRAMSVGTDAGGGYLVPTDIEASVTLTDAGTSAPIYSAARRVSTTGDTYRVVGSPNAAWSWDGENTEVSDDTPTMTNTDITLYVAQALVPMSIASTQAYAAVQVAGEVMRAGYADLVGAATTTGSGSSQPVGIVTALTGGSYEVASATTDVFAVADVYSVHETVPQRHRRNAQWFADIGIINDIRQFATDDGHALLSRLGDGTPGALLGSRITENPDMDGVINAAADNYVLVYGDFSHFVIAEALGTLVEVIPHIMGGNGRPIGARGLYMQTRFGSDSVNDAAFAMLNVT